MLDNKSRSGYISEDAIKGREGARYIYNNPAQAIRQYIEDQVSFRVAAIEDQVSSKVAAIQEYYDEKLEEIQDDYDEKIEDEVSSRAAVIQKDCDAKIKDCDAKWASMYEECNNLYQSYHLSGGW